MIKKTYKDFADALFLRKCMNVQKLKNLKKNQKWGKKISVQKVLDNIKKIEENKKRIEANIRKLKKIEENRKLIKANVCKIIDIEKYLQKKKNSKKKDNPGLMNKKIIERSKL